MCAACGREREKKGGGGGGAHQRKVTPIKTIIYKLWVTDFTKLPTEILLVQGFKTRTIRGKVIIIGGRLHHRINKSMKHREDSSREGEREREREREGGGA